LGSVALLISAAFLKTVRVHFGGGSVDGILGDARAEEERVGRDIEDTFLRDFDSNDFILTIGLGDVGDASNSVDDSLMPGVLRVFTVSNQVEAIGNDIVVGFC
jgi:hypothetical protein